jgi:hypothetical protein
MSFSKPIILVIAVINNKKKSSVGVILINVRAILINVGAILMGVILQWGDLTRYLLVYGELFTHYSSTILILKFGILFSRQLNRWLLVY